jgi:ornithine carbamoyltransferase
VNISDTLNMLANYRTGINAKVNISDTLNMLANYRTGINAKVNISDTLNMLANYRTGINAKVNISDTLNMLANYRTGINDKVNISDTLNMLANYRTEINSKVNISDTTSMLLPYLRDADTTAMLANYSLGIDAKITAVAASKVTGILPIANGGTNSSTQNFVDLTTVQTVAGSKSFSGSTTMQGSLTGNNSNTSTIAGFSANVNTQTGTTYTLVASDNGKIITLNNAGSITLTVPSLFIGFNCMVVQLGVGIITLTASGNTISNRSSFTKTAGKNAICTLVQLGASSFISAGDMGL